MKPATLFLPLIIAIIALNGCTTVIDAKLDTGPTQLSVDALLTNQAGTQTIRLTQTAGYFDNSSPPAATSAIVTVTDDKGNVYRFLDSTNTGYYVWKPTGKDTLGHVGRTYQLTIAYGGETFRSSSKINRVPPIDSVVFVKRKLNPISTTEGYRAEFYAMDIPGQADYYRVRYFRNGELQNKPANLITTQDGGFRTSTGVTDGLMFIAPIRRSINPDSLYALKDIVKVELHSLTGEAFTFWQQVRAQVTNGGLFATPPTNVPTNINNANPAGRPATGFFITSAVSSRTATVADANIRVRED